MAMRRALIAWLPVLLSGSLAPAAAFAQLSKAPQVRLQGTWWPSASNGFKLNDVFPISHEAASALVRSALDENKISTAPQATEQGVIVTEFLYPDAGRRPTNASIQVRRFRYKIQTVPLDPTHSQVQVTSTIESSMQVGWNHPLETLDWRDITDSPGSSEISAVLRNWLLEQVERASNSKR